MATQEELRQQALAAPKTAPRPVVARDPAAYAYDDPFMANAERYTQMLDEGSQRYRVPEARRAEETGPVVDSKDFRIMARHLPPRRSEWEDENKERAIWFDKVALGTHTRGPQARMEAGLAARADAEANRLKEQQAIQDAAYYGGIQNLYKNVGENLQHRNQIATGGEMAADRDRAGIYQGAQVAAGYARGTDAEAEINRKQRQRELAVEHGVPPAIAFDPNRDPIQEMQKQSLRDVAPQPILPPFTPEGPSQMAPIPLDVDVPWYNKFSKSILNTMGLGLGGLQDAISGEGITSPGIGQQLYLGDQGNIFTADRSPQFLTQRAIGGTPQYTEAQRIMLEKIKGKTLAEIRAMRARGEI